MKLAAKLMLVFLVAVMLLTGVASYFSVQRAFWRFERRQQQLAERAAQELDETLAQAYRENGLQGVLQVLEQSSPRYRQVQLEWFRVGPSPPQGRAAVSPRTWSRITSGEVVSILSEDASGNRRLHTYYPLSLGDGSRGGLEVTTSLEDLDHEIRETVASALLSIGGMALVAFGLVLVAGLHWVARPLRKLIDKAQRVGQGNFSEPLQIHQRDELGQLAYAINDMCDQLAEQQETIRREAAERLATLEQLRHADRLKTVGRLAAGIAHELGTPLNVVTGRAGLIASGRLSAEDVQTSARTIKQEAERIAGIIRQLLDFARHRAPQRLRSDLGRLVEQTAELLRPLAEKKGIGIRCAVAGDVPPVELDAGQMQQVLTNILVNAIQSMPGGGVVELQVQTEERLLPGTGLQTPRRVVSVAVTDHGVGIPRENLEHIFEPFYTTKEVGEGTGLGLSIAYGIVQEHGGWIDVQSTPGEGSRFTVYLPLEPPAGTEGA